MSDLRTAGEWSALTRAAVRAMDMTDDERTTLLNLGTYSREDEVVLGSYPPEVQAEAFASAATLLDALRNPKP